MIARSLNRRLQFARHRLFPSRPDPRFAKWDLEVRGQFDPHKLFRYFLTSFDSYRSPGGAYAFLPGEPSAHGYFIDGLEGVTRLLPLVGAWLSGGRSSRITLFSGKQIDLVETFSDTLRAAFEEGSREAWPMMKDFDQSIVEAGDVALAMWLGKKTLWHALSLKTRERIVNWLHQVNDRKVHDNNWHLFVVIVNAALKSLGEAHDEVALSTHYERFKSFHLGEGWFSDGPIRGKKLSVDYYNAWQMRYSLDFLSRMLPDFDREFLETTRRQFLAKYQHVFAVRGIPLMGRSLCYRLATPAPLVLSFAPPVARRALECVWNYFLEKESLANGTITQGYHRKDSRFLDNYSGPASPLWGLRSLIAAYSHADDSPFWKTKPGKLPIEEGNFLVDIPAARWQLAGDKTADRVTLRQLEIARTSTHSVKPYTLAARVRELMRGCTMRPGNYDVLYGMPEYFSDAPISS